MVQLQSGHNAAMKGSALAELSFLREPLLLSSPTYKRFLFRPLCMRSAAIVAIAVIAAIAFTGGTVESTPCKASKVRIKWCNSIPGEIFVVKANKKKLPVPELRREVVATVEPTDQIWIRLNHVVASSQDIVPLYNADLIYGINADDCEFSDELVAAIANFPNLRALTARNTTVATSAFTKIGQAKSLISLDVSNTRFVDKDLLLLPRSLQSLKIANCNFSDEGCKSIGRFSSLAELSVAGTQISDRSIEYIRQLPHLIDLNIAYCNLTDGSVNHILEYRPLERLDIKAIPFSHDAMTKLVQGLRTNWLIYDRTQARDCARLEFQSAVTDNNWKRATEVFGRAVAESLGTGCGAQTQWQVSLKNYYFHKLAVGDISESDKAIKSLCELSALAEKDKALSTLADLLWKKSDYDAAYQFVKTLRPPKRPGWFMALRYLASKLEGPHNPKHYRPLTYWRQAHEVFVLAEGTTDDPSELLLVHNSLTLNSFWLWDLPEAEKYCRQTLDEGAGLSGQEMPATRLILARVLLCRKNYTCALVEVQKVLPALPKLTLEDQETALTVKSNCLRALSRTNEAEKCVAELKALKLRKTSIP